MNNEGAIEFYKKFGFEIVETKEHYYKRIEPADAHVLQKNLKNVQQSSNNNTATNTTTSNSQPQQQPLQQNSVAQMNGHHQHHNNHGKTKA